jgi:hypothetical protein
MMAKQSEFFASRTGKNRTIGEADHNPTPIGAAAAKTIKVIVSN